MPQQLWLEAEGRGTNPGESIRCNTHIHISFCFVQCCSDANLILLFYIFLLTLTRGGFDWVLTCQPRDGLDCARLAKEELDWGRPWLGKTLTREPRQRARLGGAWPWSLTEREAWLDKGLAEGRATRKTEAWGMKVMGWVDLSLLLIIVIFFSYSMFILSALTFCLFSLPS